MNRYPVASSLPPLPRRRFVQGLVAGGVISALPAWAWSATNPGAAAQSPPVLTGTEFDLVIDESPVNFTGKAATATTINGSLPGPTLRWREGTTVTIRVTNRLQEHTSIHWHGIILPFQMDGVPGISFDGIPPGTTFTYRFQVKQHGSYWYHSHSGFQEMTGVYGSLIIDPADAGKDIRADRDYTMLLSDWTDEDPMRVLKKLKVQGAYYNYNQPTLPDFIRDVSKDGFRSALDKRKMWNEMRMSLTDLADLSSATLTYLANGMTPAGNWTGIFSKGETVRLRFVNGSGNTFYDVRIPGVKLKVVQVDGINCEPVSVDEFRFGPGETYDVLVVPSDDAHTIFAQAMERTGYARATLAVRAGLEAPVPALDKIQWLSMKDMMGGMDHSAMGAMGGMGGMAGMAGMDHSAMGQGAPAANALATPSTKARHARTEYGPSTDMRVDMARTNLDDPGIGLRDTGRRALTLADIHTIGGAMDARGPGREIELHLTGNMERYSWSFDGVEYGKSTPVRFKHGERVRVILHNDTMMTHPMHLHGLWSELETPEGAFQARRHTIPVQPAQRISFLVTADALGRWAWHCHLMLHMDAGMFREAIVA